MGFRINQNIGAQTALNAIQGTDMKIGKSIERLSSGLRIVRGADDPSGLVISERFRSQVEGIGQAVRNSQDGINMVQTAEGALDEVSNVLRNMRNLAIHAANTGPNDTETLKADQNQISEAINTLDRIASQTQFGAKKVLDGSAGVTGTVTDANVSFVEGDVATAAGTYAVNVTTAAVKGKVTSNANAGAAVARGTMDFTAAGAGSGANLDGTATATLTGALTGGTNIDVALASGDDMDAIVQKINDNTDVQSAGLTASNDGGTLTIKSDRLSTGAVGDLDVTIAAGTSTNQAAVSGLGGAGTNNYGSDTATGATKLRADELLTFSDGTNNINVALQAGMTTSAATSAINSALDTAGIRVTASFDGTAGTFAIENDDYGSSSTVSNSFSSNATGALSTGLAGAAGTSYNIAASSGALSGDTNGADVAGTIGGFAATGSGQFLTGDSGTNVDSLQLKIDSAATGSHGTVTVANNSLTFQIGAFAEQTESLAIGSMAASNLGRDASGTSGLLAEVNIENIDVTAGNGVGAQDAIKVIDAAISQVTELRSEIGSFQKDILESTVRTLGVAKLNLAATESNIRDADFAMEMQQFSKNQILSQTGMSMLTQANQSSQSVLSLFR